MANTAINHDPAATFPGSSTDTAIVKWSGSGGKTLANSGVTIDSSNNLTVPGNITTTGYVHLTGDEKALRLYNGSNFISIAAPSGLGADYTFTLPLNDGAANEFLQTNGSGVLVWAAPAAIADDSIVEAKLDVSNGPSNGLFLQAQSGEGGGLTWATAAPIASPTFTTGATSPAWITGNDGTVKFMDNDGNHYFTLAAHATTTADVAYTWPAAGPGTSGFALTSTTGGVMSWVAAGGAALSGTTDNTIVTVTGADAMQGEASLTFDNAALAFSRSHDGNNAINLINDSNTSSASTRLTIQCAGASAGDATALFHAGGDSYCIGVDNSDSNKFKIAATGGNLGTNDRFVMTSVGEITMPSQPCVLAYNSAQNSNVTGNNAWAIMEADTELFDQNDDFNNTTDSFVAPVTGKYLISCAIDVGGLIAASFNFYWELVETDLTIEMARYNRSSFNNTIDRWKTPGTVVLSMDAGNTVYARINIDGDSGDNADILGHATRPLSWISVVLVA